MFQHLGVKSVAHYQNEEVEDASRELQKELVSVIAVFVAKNVKRAAKKKQERPKKKRYKRNANHNKFLPERPYTIDSIQMLKRKGFCINVLASLDGHTTNIFTP